MLLLTFQMLQLSKMVEQGISFVSDEKKGQIIFKVADLALLMSYEVWIGDIFSLKHFAYKTLSVMFLQLTLTFLVLYQTPVGGEVTCVRCYCLSNHWGLHGRCYNVLFILYWKTDFIICKNGPWFQFFYLTTEWHWASLVSLSMSLLHTKKKYCHISPSSIVKIEHGEKHH